MRVLITGAAGFIGSNLALELQKSHDVIGVDDFSCGHFKNLLGFEGEMLPYSLKELQVPRDVDAVFHQAAITDTTVSDQRMMVDTNTVQSKRILDSCVSSNIPLIYASSAAVYGAAPSPQKESSAGKPLNVYGFSKYLFDLEVQKCMKKHPDFHVVGLRYFNVFGPGESYKGKMSSMIWQLAQQMKKGSRPRLFKWGEHRRDFVYVKDVVDANLLSWKSKSSGIINVGSGAATSFKDIIVHLNRALKVRFEPEYFDNPYVGVYQDLTQADLTLAKKLVGYVPKWDIKTAIEDYSKSF